MKSLSPARRSATQGPSYSNSATSRNGVEVDLESPPAHLLQSANRRAKTARCSSSPELQVLGTGHRERHAAAGAPPGRAGARPPRPTSKPQCVGHRQAEDRHAVERTAGRHHALGAEQARRRLEPDDVTASAGTRPDPAVSVPRAKLTSPAATATAEPELEPPETYFGSKTLRQAP